MRVSEIILKILKQKLNDVKQDLVKASESYQAAVEDGDGLHDNPHQQKAKMDIELLDQKVKELEKIISECTVKDLDSEILDTGDSFILFSEDKNERELVLVERELLPYLDNAISVDSPLGKAVLGASYGSEVTVTTPSGQKTYMLRKHKG